MTYPVFKSLQEGPPRSPRHVSVYSLYSTLPKPVENTPKQTPSFRFSLQNICLGNLKSHRRSAVNLSRTKPKILATQPRTYVSHFNHLTTTNHPWVTPKPQRCVLLKTGKGAFPFNTWNSCSSLLRKSICSNKTFWSSSNKGKRKVVLLICINNSWKNSCRAIHYYQTKYFSSYKKVLHRPTIDFVQKAMNINQCNILF